MKIICINGFPKSGKNLFTSFCFEDLGSFGIEISTVDFVKDIAEECGWNGQKTAKDRKFLSDLKDLLAEWNDVPFQKVLDTIRDFWSIFRNYGIDDSEAIIFIHVREPRELQRYKNELNARTLLIRRPTVENNEQSNHADSEVLNFDYDYIIWNDGTEEDLENKANEFIINLSKEDWKSLYPEEIF